MLWAATAVALAGLAAAPAPQQLVLRVKDVPSGYRLIASASGPTGQYVYRAAFTDGPTTRLSSVAAVYPDAQSADAMVSQPEQNCGKTGTTRKLPVGAPLGSHALVCASHAKGYDAYAVVWRDGRVFATVALVGRHGQVSAKLALRLARLQQARIADARSAGPPAA
ncbi:MAG TPA: hypothetical protein VIU86_06880 [Gaiellaceae bacterium]